MFSVMDFYLCTYSVKYTCAVWINSTFIEYIIACINCCYVKQWQWIETEKKAKKKLQAQKEKKL